MHIINKRLVVPYEVLMFPKMTINLVFFVCILELAKMGFHCLTSFAKLLYVDCSAFLLHVIYTVNWEIFLLLAVFLMSYVLQQGL